MEDLDLHQWTTRSISLLYTWVDWRTPSYANEPPGLHLYFTTESTGDPWRTPMNHQVCIFTSCLSRQKAKINWLIAWNQVCLLLGWNKILHLHHWYRLLSVLMLPHPLLSYMIVDVLGFPFSCPSILLISLLSSDSHLSQVHLTCSSLSPVLYKKQILVQNLPVAGRGTGYCGSAAKWYLSTS